MIRTWPTPAIPPHPGPGTIPLLCRCGTDPKRATAPRNVA
uniref:Uncharacterized protein n=1 Tax=Arundo donax TaxID=35708 RepID=A0A0A8Z7M0_ARUDO